MIGVILHVKFFFESAGQSSVIINVLLIAFNILKSGGHDFALLPSLHYIILLFSGILFSLLATQIYE
jgi:hypothetical protein